MDIVVDNNISKSLQLEVGDILIIKEWGTYIVADEETGYILRKPKDWQGLNGFHSSLEKLSESLLKHENVTHYSQKHYRLEIVKK